MLGSGRVLIRGTKISVAERTDAELAHERQRRDIALDWVSIA
jgi:hypothetical protein